MKRGVVQVFILLIVLSSILACKKEQSNPFSKAITLSFIVDERYNETLNYENVMRPVFTFSFTDAIPSDICDKRVKLLSSIGFKLALSSKTKEGKKMALSLQPQHFPPFHTPRLSL